MECTQQLDLEFSQTQTERILPEQIGFLGILGTKYPVKKGPNKIGRDPQSCDIILNLNSISRQHAVLNVLNGKHYMLMDLDSANKTRLNNKTLQAYIPVPISNGDTVQFGDVFGIFRLLVEDDDLPCTQAVELPSTQVVDVPDTPAHRHAARIKHATIPESPDVSDKDDSFILPSQPKQQNRLKSPGSNFIKTSSKTIAIKPVRSNQIDNIFWSTSKKSSSFNLDDSMSAVNESQNEEIREIENSSETQLPPKCASIYSQDTQLPPPDHNSPGSIYTAETQLPPKCASIYSQETQLPPPDQNCPGSICTAETQLPPKCASIYSQDTQLPPPDQNSTGSIYTAETQLPPKCASIYSQETQLPPPDQNSPGSIYTAETQLPPKCASIYSQDTQLPPPDQNSPGSIYTAETQMPPKSIYSQETQLFLPDLAANKENDNNMFNSETRENYIFNASTQLPKEMPTKSKIDESINDANTELPNGINAANNVDIFKGETQLRFKFDLSNRNKSIYEMETQAPLSMKNESTDSIYTAETQLPPMKASHSIYSQETQLPNLDEFDSPKTIHDFNTQLPSEANRISENDDIFDADTQLQNRSSKFHTSITNDENQSDVNFQSNNKKSTASNEVDDYIFHPDSQKGNNSVDTGNTSKDNSKNKFDQSDDVILFDEVEAINGLDDLDASQPILGGDALPQQEESEDIPLSQSDTITDDDFEIRLEDNIIESKPAKRSARANSDISTDCEDFDLLPTKKISEISVNEDGDTDCEDDKTGRKKCEKSAADDNSKVNLDELATQVIPAAGSALHFEDLATQVISTIVVDNGQTDTDKPTENPTNEPSFEDMLTQAIPENEFCNKDANFEDLATQVIPEDVTKIPDNQFSEEVISSPFKVPLQTALKNKKKDISKVTDIKKSLLVKPNVKAHDDKKYYAATQELYRDLCSQETLSIESKTVNNNLDEEKLGTKFANLDGEIEISVKKNSKDSSESSDGEEKVDKFVRSLSVKQISEVIGADVTMVKRVPSDPSDVEVTPKKVRPCKFMETLLPDSQEIKTSVSFITRSEATDSSSESEKEKESQEETPIVFRKKKRAKDDVKSKLVTKFDVQALPTRIITRTRKPTSKLQESDDAAKKRSRNILKPKFLNDSEQDDVDTEIISENITRLRSKCDKKNIKDTSADNETNQIIKTDNNTQKTNEENGQTSKDETNQDTNSKSKYAVIDLTTLDEEKPKSRRKHKTSKSNKDTLSGDIKIDDTKSVEKQKSKEKNTSEQCSEPRKNDRIKKGDMQDKITNYTIKINDSSVSNSSKKIDNSIRAKDDKNDSTKCTTHSNKNKDIVCKNEKSIELDDETTKRKRGRPTKRKRGRPTKKDKEEDKRKDKKNDSKDETELKDNKKELKRRKDDIPEILEQKEVRRSKRQRGTKVRNESRKDDQSTVYSVSSESGVDSPKRKRGHLYTDAPGPKRTRSNASSLTISSETNSVSTTLNSNCSSLRSTPSLPASTHRVLFTAFPNEAVKVTLQKLGAVIVSDVSACTVVLTMQLRRTFKLLCAVALGKPVVGPEWVQACVDQQAIVDPWQYLLQDKANEARFRFSLRQTLCGPRRYLKGYYLSSTPSVLPSAPEMKLIVECSGGVWQPYGPKGRWLAVSCAADRALHADLRARGALVVTSELILTGVLRQQLDIEGNLFK